MWKNYRLIRRWYECETADFMDEEQWTGYEACECRFQSKQLCILHSIVIQRHTAANICDADLCVASSIWSIVLHAITIYWLFIQLSCESKTKPKKQHTYKFKQSTENLFNDLILDLFCDLLRLVAIFSLPPLRRCYIRDKWISISVCVCENGKRCLSSSLILFVCRTASRASAELLI